MDQNVNPTLPRLVLINMEMPPSEEDALYERKAEIYHLNAGCTVAVARHARQSGQYASTIICPSKSALRACALNNGLHATCFDKKLLRFWALWRWQGKIPAMKIGVIGASGLRPGIQLLKMRKKLAQKLNGVFFDLPEKMKNPEVRALTQCICGAEYIAEQLKTMAATGQKSCGASFQTIAPGIDLDNYPLIRPRNANRFVFAMGESLTENSGALQVVRAMSALWQHPDLPEWEVRMFGGGPGYAEIMQEAEKLGVLPRLSLLNYQTPEEIMAHADAWLAPGSNPRELPATFWGGLASGLPVIASRTRLHEQRMPQPDCALLTDSDNPQELASAMLKIMQDNDLRSRYAAGASKYRSWLGLDGLAQRLLPLLAEH